MPTLTRPPEAQMPPTQLVVDGRLGDGIEAGVVAAPPEELLPSGGPDRPAATHVPPVSRPARGTTRTHASFQRRVRAIHAQLLPLQSRTALAWSYAREAGRGSGMRAPIDEEFGLTAVQAAYALRWLELAEPGVAQSTRLDLETLLRP
jgi:hypothetical protein